MVTTTFNAPQAGRRSQMRSSVRLTAVVAVQVIVLLVVLMGFAALAIDYGAISVTRAELQSAADSAAMAGGTFFLEERSLAIASGTNFEDSVHTLNEEVSGRALFTAGLNYNLGTPLVASIEDVSIGYFDFETPASPISTDRAPKDYNGVSVVIRRTEGSPNGPLDLWFARFLGRNKANISASAIAAFDDRFAAYDPQGETTPLIPFVISEDEFFKQWNGGDDDYGYDPVTDLVSSFGDGIREIRLFPNKQNKSQSDSSDDSGADSGSDSEGGTDSGDDFGIDSGSDSGTDAGDDSGSDSGSDSGGDSDSGSAPGGSDDSDHDNTGAGNFGLLNVGGSGVGASALENAIRSGLEVEDIVNETGNRRLTFVNGDGTENAYQISGTPGMKSSLEDALQSRVGEIVGFFLYSAVTGDDSSDDSSDDSGSDSDPGGGDSDSGSGGDSDPGGDAQADSGSDSGSNSGGDSGSDSGSGDSGSDSGGDAQADSGSDSGSDSGGDSGSDSGSGDGISGTGANVEYTISGIRFGRIIEVNLTGNPDDRMIVIQPIVYSGTEIAVHAAAPETNGLLGRLMLAQ